MVFEATGSPSETVQIVPFLRRELPFRSDGAKYHSFRVLRGRAALRLQLGDALRPLHVRDGRASGSAGMMCFGGCGC